MHLCMHVDDVARIITPHARILHTCKYALHMVQRHPLTTLASSMFPAQLRVLSR